MQRKYRVAFTDEVINKQILKFKFTVRKATVYKSIYPEIYTNKKVE